MAEPKKRKTPPARMKSRLAVLSIILSIACFVVLGGRLFQMQVLHYEFWSEKAKNLQTADSVVMPNRGTIYDRNMKELAVSASTETIQINPQAVENREKTSAGVSLEEQQAAVAKLLSEKLSLDYDSVLTKIKDTSKKYKLIKKRVDKDVCDEIRAWMEEEWATKKTNGSSGIDFVPDTSRYYPQGAFASQVLGFMNDNGDPVCGLELQYNEDLTGKAGRVVRAQNAKNQAMPFDYEQYVPAEDGSSLVLTIDETIQNVLEKNLETLYHDNAKAAGGVGGIVMDVKTGEILAMAGLPDFDLNDPFTVVSDKFLGEEKSEIDAILQKYNVSAAVGEEYLSMGDKAGLAAIPKDNEQLLKEIGTARKNTQEKLWRNKLVQDTYEPGSTFKLMNVASAFESGAVTEKSTFFDSGSYKVGPDTIHCWKAGGHGSEDLTHCLMNSCNPAMVQIALKTGISKFREFFDAFGLTEKSGVDLPGEAKGVNFSDKMTEIDLAVSSFGQRFTVTPLQMLNMACAVVDNGNLKTPHVVKEILNADGTVKKTINTEVKRQVISEPTSKFMRNAMEQVVAAGTGQNAYVAGYRVGGKTATAETTTDGIYIASFIGVAPMDDPQLATIILAYDLPADVPHGGGAVAAPIAARVLGDALPYWGDEPVFSAEESDRAEYAVPNLVGMTEQQAKAALEKIGMTYRVMGDGSSSTITDQLPAAGVKLQPDCKTVLYLGGSKNTELIEVPNILGTQPTGARTTLQAAGLYMKRTGVPTKNTSYVTRTAKQYPVAGTKVAPGTVVTAEFSNSTNIGD